MKETTTESLSRVAETAKTEVVDPARVAVESALREGETFARQQGEELERWVRRQPLAAVGAAFGLGLLVSVFIRLRS